ncbi:helix-turn-helix domain-containing protein, partial [Corynebacterium sp. p3-SID1194]|uniref:helix-turn-helix domain-containing protein n=1 Tax=Corynebacterium sp. p3-SID1194 TaxID=2916105 RepID=UPI0021A37665
MAGWVSKEIRKAAVARVAAGESPYAVAEDIGVSFTTVYDWMNKVGVVGPQVAARRDRQEQLHQAAGLVQQGSTVSAAARTVGLPVGTVRNWLVKQGVHTPAPAPPRKIV